MKMSTTEATAAAASAANSNEGVYSIGDLVWAKVKGYPYWPARVVEPVSVEHMKKSVKKNLKECFVSFYGPGLSLAWVHLRNVMPFNCSQKDDLVAKSRNVPKLSVAVDEILAAASSLNSSTGSDDKKAAKNLLSMEEELELIKGTTVETKAEEEPTKRKTRSPKTPKTAAVSKKAEAAAAAATNDDTLTNTEQEQPQSAKSIATRKRNARLPVQVDKLCTPTPTTKSTRKSDDSNASGSKVVVKKEEILNESKNVPQKTRTAKKRSHSVEKELNGSLNEIDRKQKKSSQKENSEAIAEAVKSEPVVNGDAKAKVAKFESLSLIVDFELPLTKFVIEKFLELGIEVNVLNLDSNTGDENSNNEYLKTKTEQLRIIDDFEVALKKDVVFAFVDSTNVKQFDKQLFNNPINNVKFVNFSSQSYKDALFYHHYFNDNNAVYIEAPFLIFKENDVKIYASSIDESFLNSVKFILDSLTSNQVVYKGSRIGVPSTVVSLLQSSINAFHEMSNELSAKIDQIQQINDEKKATPASKRRSAVKMNESTAAAATAASSTRKVDILKEYSETMVQLFQKI